jgi:dihydrofolate synthase / folylpolyglutamate synthase
VGIDHQAFLGKTLAEIAAEKAGIAKAGVPLVCLGQPPAAMSAIARIADKANAFLWEEGYSWTADLRLRPSLPGKHQIWNANLAAQMARLAQIDESSIKTGIETAQWPGRLQKLSAGPLTRDGDIWIDGAHNPACAEAIAAELAAHPRHLILGILANKDADGIITALAPHALSLSFVEVPGHASQNAGELAGRWNARAAPGLTAAIEQVRREHGGDILVAGSLYLAGEALRLNDQIPD